MIEKNEEENWPYKKFICEMCEEEYELTHKIDLQDLACPELCGDCEIKIVDDHDQNGGIHND